MIRPKAKFEKDLANYSAVIFPKSIKVTGLSLNAAQTKAGDLFIALAGAKTHGINFLDTAIKNGAVAVLTDSKIPVADPAIPLFRCENPRHEMGLIAAWFYDQPFGKLKSIGITGTNGKTTSASFVNQILKFHGYKTALLGTVSLEINDREFSAERTTPESIDLQSFAATAVESGVTYLVMEVSSHALALDRIVGAHFNVSAFTNLTQDHLDFHGTMANYFAAKCRLFESKFSDFAVINLDNDYGIKLKSILNIPATTVSVKNQTADYSVIDFNSKNNMLTLNLADEKITTEFNFLGAYNRENLLIAVAITHQLGLSASEVAAAIKPLKAVPGRLEPITAGQNFTALVDYAHTPDAVANVLQTARQFTKGKIIAVLGCGGDRDASKRNPMGQALSKFSDVAIFTSDNPRSENAELILEQMTKGLTINAPSKVVVDRISAIEYAVSVAASNDCILVLGKGHEVGQEINGMKHPFDERLQLQTAISNAQTK